MSAPTPHNRAIDALVASGPDIRAHGFWSAMRDLASELNADIGRHPFIPDAFKIDREASEILIYEVVHYSDLTPAKLRSVAELWMDWDDEAGHDWSVRLFVQRIGEPMFEVDLCQAFHGLAA